VQQLGAEGGFITFDAVRASSTSLACKSKPEVDYYSASMTFAPPLLSLHATAVSFFFSNNSQGLAKTKPGNGHCWCCQHDQDTLYQHQRVIGRLLELRGVLFLPALHMEVKGYAASICNM